MLFHSTIFLFAFLPLLLGLYYLAGNRLRNTLLVAASWLFYIWGEPTFFLLLVLSIGMNYAFARSIGLRHERGAGSRALFFSAVSANLAVLLFFKYGFFLLNNLNWVFNLIGFGVPAPVLNTLHVIASKLPLGISFYTFMAISYVADVYRRVIPAEQHISRVAWYLSLFPYIISGPLARFRDLARQFDRRPPAAADLAEGARRFIFGLSKKILIAAPLENLSKDILRSPEGVITTPVAWLCMLAFMLQIYYDFSGYSDMAIGLGRMFGLRLPENFNYPYIAQSITEFWRRWHITLSNWFRDYVYFPLERARRRTFLDRYTNILIVFLLTGLWHGASWNFVLWGGVQGAFIVLERGRFGAALERLPRPLRHLYALLVILFSWTLFRFVHLETGLNMIRALLGAPLRVVDAYPQMFLTPEIVLALVAAIIFCLPVYPAWQRRRERRAEDLPKSAARFDLLPNLLAAALLVVSMLNVAGSTARAFIYFRF